MAQLLVVSPDATLREVVQRSVVSLGHVALTSASAVHARRTLSRTSIDVLCLDSVLPQHEIEPLYALAASNDARPVGLVYLCPPAAALVRSTLPSCLRDHIDAYLTKPLDSARASQELRRVLGRGDGHPTYDSLEVAGITLDSSRHTLHTSGQEPIALTPVEHKLLRCLMEHQGEYVSKSELLEVVWGYPPDGGAELVRAHISNLRRKLRSAGGDGLLKTMPYHGYGIVP